MRVEQLRPRLWYWTLPHPDRDRDGEYIYNMGFAKVACAAIVRRDEFVLVDPLAPDDPDDRAQFWRAVNRDVEHHGTPHVVVTDWHFSRSIAEVAERLPGTRVWVPANQPEPDGVEPTDRFVDGDELPGALVAYEGHREEPILWSLEHRTLIGGDPLVGATAGRRLRDPLRWPQEQPGIVRTLTPLLELPVELILPAYGDPVLADGAAELRRALLI